MKIDKNGSKPLHQQAEAYLRSLISKNEYKDGKLLPTEHELTKQLGISRTTLRYAINRLVLEGLLVRKKGLGTKVSNKSLIGQGLEWKSFTEEMRALGMNPKNYEILVKWEKANEVTASFFQISEGEMLLKTERIRGSDEEPFVFFISYFNPKIGLTGDENFSKPLYGMLEEKFNIVAKTSNEIISAGTAGTISAQKLGIQAGTPILRRERKVYDRDEVPIEYNIGIYKAESYKYSVTLERDIL